jgi:hypothetical protein
MLTNPLSESVKAEGDSRAALPHRHSIILSPVVKTAMPDSCWSMLGNMG